LESCKENGKSSPQVGLKRLLIPVGFTVNIYIEAL